MAKKKNRIKQKALAGAPPPINFFSVPPEGVSIPAEGAMETVRKELGLSQPALARECGVSRDVIANYESGRTRPSIDDLLQVWRVLEVKARGRKLSENAPKASELLLGLLWWAKANSERLVNEIDGKIEYLQRRREGLNHRIAEFEAEEDYIKAKLKEWEEALNG